MIENTVVLNITIILYDKGGNTPLHHAAYRKSLNVTALLIEKGANLDAVAHSSIH